MSLRTVRVVTFLGLLLIFTVIAFLAVAGAEKGGGGHRVMGVLGVIMGPFVGAMARDLQSCCVQASLSIFWYCAPVLLLGIALQWVKMAYAFKVSVWLLGWFVWFGGGLVSYGHALN